ncbi:hypothetical protein Tco_0705290 [Tanacetum coccineum]|uniref:Uncharacterized protein n=1 Tax=Tanacetum coccineum TaxID=301880 RepID=A0ABQ4Y489_9ASTR
MPSLPSPEPTVSCFDDLEFFKDFENEFSAIVYNDAQTSKSDLLTEPILSPQHIDEFDLDDETSLSEYDEEELNVLYFNDLFPFNIIHLNDLKLEKDNDDNEVDIIQSSGVITEYLVNISKRRAFWSLNEDILKITILKTNTSYPSRKIQRIRACTHQRPQRKEDQYVNIPKQIYESRKSPIAELFEVDSGRIFIRHCGMLRSITLNVLAESQG